MSGEVINCDKNLFTVEWVSWTYFTLYMISVVNMYSVKALGFRTESFLLLRSSPFNFFVALSGSSYINKHLNWKLWSVFCITWSTFHIFYLHSSYVLNLLFATLTISLWGVEPATQTRPYQENVQMRPSPAVSQVIDS